VATRDITARPLEWNPPRQAISRVPYLPGLDGMRALAVVAVMIYHTNNGWLPGGFIGVEVFFVISGYLITRLLLAEHHENARIDLRAFYVRRVLRLGPALVVALIVAAALAAGPLADEFAVPRWAAFATTLSYTANWLQVYEPGSAGPLIHTWSLAIEEQFYLLWPPLLVVLLRRRLNISSLAAALAIAALAVVAARVVFFAGLHDQTQRLWFATPMRADGLLLGCALGALAFDRPLPRIGSVASAGALIGLIAIFVTADNQYWAFSFVGGITIATALSGVLLAATTSGSGLVCRGLALRPLVLIGRVSYGLYLYHAMIFLWIRESTLTTEAQYVVEFTLTAAVTVLSYVIVERPALRLKERVHLAVSRRAAPAHPW
jgi:peptidoglycan/LPS O-acetylase OafA/YrhL